MTRVVFVGLGWVTNEVWLPAFQSCSGASIIGGVDPITENRHRFTSLSGCNKTFDNLIDALNLSPDLVVIATPNFLHIPYAKEVISRNIAVLIEKPICRNFNELNDLRKVLKGRNIPLYPSCAIRWRTDVSLLAKLIRNKDIGNIRWINASWIRSKGVPQIDSWFINKEESGGGVLLDLGWHILDICHWFLGSLECNKVNSYFSSDFLKSKDFNANWKKSQKSNVSSYTSDVEDHAICSFTTTNNVSINIRVAWASHQSTDTTTLIIGGDEGEIELKTTFGFSKNRVSKPSIIIKKKGTEGFRE
jgi:oxidoreductase